MTIRKLFPLLLVAVAAAILSPERGSAQEGEMCWKCDQCAFDPDPSSTMCVGLPLNNNPVIGATRCSHPSFCECRSRSIGFCFQPETAADSQTRQHLLEETLAAIRVGKSIPADGPFFYVRRGMNLVVRSKCDRTEAARVAVAEVARTPTVVGG